MTSKPSRTRPRRPAAVSAPPARATAAGGPWGWLTALAIVPLILRSRGVPLGEPVADDFLFLRPVLFGGWNLFDGGGAPNYWRPLGRQLYFLLAGGGLLDRPWLVAVLHAVLLAASGVLLYRALRTRLPGPAAMAAAVFPAGMESARMLVAWPSDFQDLGALFFGALALERASRGRTPAMLAAGLAALLCKEVALALVVLLPWVPLGVLRPAAARGRAAIATFAMIGLWMLGYHFVARHAALTVLGSAAPAGDPLLTRAEVTLRRAFDSAFSLSPGARAAAVPVALGLAGLVFGGAIAFVTSPAARARVRAALPIAAWGAAWFALAAATLVPLFPEWADYRAVFAAAGLGLAIGVPLAAAHPALGVALVLLRLVALGMAPGVAARIDARAVERGSVLDFPKHARVQRLMADVHRLLRERRPSLPRGAAIGQHYLPTMSEYAFAGSGALRSWYRDSTLRWVRFEDSRRLARDGLAGVVEFQPVGGRSVALVEPAALAAMDRGLDAVRSQSWRESERAFLEADSLQLDRGARVFIATIGGKLALCRLQLDDPSGADREARLAYAQWPDNPDSRFVLAMLAFRAGRLGEARARLDTLLAFDPTDAGAVQLRQQVITRGTALGTPTPATVGGGTR